MPSEPGAVHLRVLGPLAVTVDGVEVAMTRPLDRRLLLLLAVQSPTATSDGNITIRLWGAGLPPTALASLRNAVLRLRRTLGPESVLRVGGGYRLSDSVTLDSEVLSRQLDIAEGFLAEGMLDRAVAAIEAGLAVVRGGAFEEVAHEWWATAAADQLNDRVSDAQERWSDLVIEAGQGERHLPRLLALARSQPHRERRWERVIEVLAAAGRRVEALRAVNEARAELAEFGIGLGPHLADLERRLLGTPHTDVGGDGELDDSTSAPDLVSSLGDEVFQLACMVVIGADRCAPSVLADALGCSAAAVLDHGAQLAQLGLLSSISVDGFPLSDSERGVALAAEVRGRLSLASERELRTRLIEAGRCNPAATVLVAEQLLLLRGLADAGQRELRHHAVADAIDVELRAHRPQRACGLAQSYLELEEDRSSRAALRALLEVGTALLAHGATKEGMAVLDGIEPTIRSMDDGVLLADLILARGPALTGARETENLAIEAESVFGCLEASDVERRGQLATWAAHHWANVGDRARALTMLDRMTGELPTTPAEIRSLELGVRAQVELSSVDAPGPSAAQSALAALRRHANASRDEAGIAATAVLGLAGALSFGTRRDVQRARGAIESAATRLPRPDLQWYPAASRAAELLALGELDAADKAITAATALGESLGFDTATPTGRTQRIVHMYESGQLGLMSDVLMVLTDRPDTNIAMVATTGLALVEAGDLERAACIAESLCTTTPLLSRAGRAWTLAAFAAAEMTAALGHRRLAASLRGELDRWSGTGLATLGVMYLGAVDGVLALLAQAEGDPARALDHARRAVRQERARGWTWWAARAQSLVDRLG